MLHIILGRVLPIYGNSCHPKQVVGRTGPVRREGDITFPGAPAVAKALALQIDGSHTRSESKTKLTLPSS